jgi:hypothetical protein
MFVMQSSGGKSGDLLTSFDGVTGGPWWPELKAPHFNHVRPVFSPVKLPRVNPEVALLSDVVQRCATTTLTGTHGTRHASSNFSLNIALFLSTWAASYHTQLAF